MLLATCALSAAGWGRLPLLPPGTFYAGVDLLIVMGLVRDVVVNRRVHVVYKVVLPTFAAGQLFAMFVLITNPEWWAKLAVAIVG